MAPSMEGIYPAENASTAPTQRLTRVCSSETGGLLADKPILVTEDYKHTTQQWGNVACKDPGSASAALGSWLRAWWSPTRKKGSFPSLPSSLLLGPFTKNLFHFLVTVKFH